MVRWADITQLEKSATLLLPDVIKVNTRTNEHVFSVFLNINETFKLAEQLANIAMRQLLDNKGFEQDRSLPKLKKKSPKKVSALKRWGPVQRVTTPLLSSNKPRACVFTALMCCWNY